MLVVPYKGLSRGRKNRRADIQGRYLPVHQMKDRKAHIFRIRMRMTVRVGRFSKSAFVNGWTVSYIDKTAHLWANIDYENLPTHLLPPGRVLSGSFWWYEYYVINNQNKCSGIYTYGDKKHSPGA